MKKEHTTDTLQTTSNNYFDNRLALISNIRHIKDMPQKRFLVEGFLVLIVTNGELSLSIDGKDYQLAKGDIFSCLPRNILEHSTASEDAEAYIIYMSPDYAEEIAQRVRVDWTFSMIMSKYERLHAEPEELRSLLLYFELIKTKCEACDSKFKKQIIDSLFVSTCYEICDIRARCGQITANVQSSAAENLMQRFMKLLYESDHRMRSVQEYADALCVSSKYFSSVCRQVTGKNARDLINEDIIRSIRLLIADNSLNIKQIADSCGFKNQSHFGTFFRRHVGMSPQQYRDSLRHRE